MNSNISDVGQEMDKDPLYVMTVELEKDRSESIKIYAESKPEELAYEFCKKNNLDYVSMEYLTNQIKNLVNTASNKKTNSTHCNHILEEEHSHSNCIIEEEDEDHHHSYQKTVNTCEHYIDFIPEETKRILISAETDKTDIENQEEEKSIAKNDKKLSVQNKTERSCQNNTTDYHNNKNQRIDSKSVLSYKQFYNALKMKIEDKDKNKKLLKSHYVKNKYVTKRADNQQTFTTRYNNNKDTLSLAYNEKKYINYLKQLNNLDNIFQNQQSSLDHKIICVLNHFPTYTSNTKNNNFCQGYYPLNFDNISKSQIYLIETDINNSTDYYQYHDSNTGIYKKSQVRNKFLSSKKGKNYTKANLNKALINYNNTAILSKMTQSYYTEHKHYCSSLDIKSNCKLNKNGQNYQHKYIQRSTQHKIKCLLQNKGQQLTTKENNCYAKEKNNELLLIDHLFTKKKEQIFKHLFSLLDSTQNHTINIETMDTSRIPSTIFNIIKPLIYKIKHSENEILSEKSFINGCSKSFENLPFNFRRALLDYSTKIKLSY